MIGKCDLFRSQANGSFDILFLSFFSGMPTSPGVNMKDFLWI